MSSFTLALNKNIISRKQLVGIANFVRRNSEARFLSRGTTVLSTEQEIRTTKKAQVLIPLLQGIKDVVEVLAQAKSGGVKSTELSLNEFLVALENEKITDPIIYRPRDGEVINASSIMDRMSASYNITATTAKDRAYYENILAQGKTGVNVAVGGNTGGKLKAEIVESKLNVSPADNTTGTEIKDNATVFGSQIRAVRTRIKKHKDRFLQSRISNKDIAIVINADGENVLQNDARYNMYTETAINKNGALDLEIDAMFDGSPVLVSKQLPEGVDFIVKLFGAATSLFALREVLNMDKVPGVQAYLSSMEFDEGTGVWLPHLISIGTSDTIKNPVQSAVGFEAYDLPINTSTTVSGNKNNPDGLPTPNSTDTLVMDDINKDGKTDADEVRTFNAKDWYSDDYATDKANLTKGQIAQLKKALKVAKDATDAVIQTALSKRK